MMPFFKILTQHFLGVFSTSMAYQWRTTVTGGTLGAPRPPAPNARCCPIALRTGWRPGNGSEKKAGTAHLGPRRLLKNHGSCASILSMLNILNILNMGY